MFITRIRNFVSVFLQFTRLSEYYGSIFFITCLGLFLAEITDPYKILLVIVANTSAVSFSFMFNDVQDADDDRLDPQKASRNVLTSHLLRYDWAYFLCVVTVAISGGLYYLLGWPTFLFGCLSLVSSFLYSWKPLRIKAMPIVDIIAHSIQLGTTQFLAASSLGSVNCSLVILISISIFFMSAIADVNNELRDYDVDRAANLTNTASTFNMRSWTGYIQYGWLFPLFVIFVVTLIKLSVTAWIFTFLFFALILLVYFSSSSETRREYFFYVRSQQIAVVWGCILLFLG